MPRLKGGEQVRRVFAATRNVAKAAALRGLLEPAAVVALPSRDISIEPSETGHDIDDIATHKAAAWSRALRDAGDDDVTIATDGGLLVPGLGTAWDPRRTRRFAGENAAPIEMATRLLDLAKDLKGDERRIGWIEAAAIARHGEALARFVAESPEGTLAPSVDRERMATSNGFWVPYVWQCPEYGGKLIIDLTPAEVAAREDHWAQLGRQIRAYLAELE